MSLWELLLLAIGLSMDAFAVSVCKGLSLPKLKMKAAVLCGIWFGGFQALMPLVGYLLGKQFSNYITSFDHWIAFGLLAFIGFNMVREAFAPEDEGEESDPSLDIKSMFILAVATSIDALAVGVTFAFLPNTNIVAAISFIGVVTFMLSMAGVQIGSAFGTKFKSKAEIAGGVILILLGLKILVEHLFFA